MLDTLIEATAGYYNLPRELVCEHLSRVVSEYFSQSLQKKIICTVQNDKVETYQSSEEGDREIAVEISQRDIPEIMKRYKMLLDISDSYKRYYEHFSLYHMAIVEGTSVGSETIQITGLEGVIGICCKRDMGKVPAKGAKVLFYVKRISLSWQDTRVRCVFYLSRTARELPVKLLESSIKNPNIKLRCYKRVVGAVSFIESSGYIRRKHIERVSEQLKEVIAIRRMII